MKSEMGLFFAGTAVGIAAAMLFTPKSGPETREYLRSKANEGADFVKQRAGEVREKAMDMVERGKKTVQEQVDTVAAAMDAGKQAYREAANPTAVPSAS